MWVEEGQSREASSVMRRGEVGEVGVEKEWMALSRAWRRAVVVSGVRCAGLLGEGGTEGRWKRRAVIW